jgi:nuclear GTP-binding protein
MIPYTNQLVDNSKKAFIRELKKVIKGSDVIIEVLDARDPIGTRCPSIEQKILAEDPNKKIILVLNKIGTLSQDFLGLEDRRL